MTENFKDSFLKVITERLSNPVLFGFCVSWVIVNYKFFILLFKIKEYEKFKISLGSEVFSVYGYEWFWLDCSQWFYNGIWLPSILAVIYIFLSPIVMIAVYEWRMLTDAWMRARINKWDGNFLPTRKEWNELEKERYDLRELAESRAKEVGAMKGTVYSQRMENEKLEKSIDELKSKVAEQGLMLERAHVVEVNSPRIVAVPKVLNTNHVRGLFEWLANAGGVVKYGERPSSLTELEFKDAVAKLENQDLLEVDEVGQYSLTNNGLDLAVNMKKATS